MKTTTSAILIGLYSLLIAPINAQDIPLEYGAYDIGFKFQTTLNYAQKSCGTDAYSTVGKPVIMGVWYPSQRTTRAAMSLRDYVYMRGAEEKSPLNETKDFALESWFNYTMEEYMDSTYAAKQRDFEKSLELKCKAIYGAKESKGQFPVIIYHHGAGGTYDDNALMCEYFASHGFVVVSSSFLECRDNTVFESGDWNASVSDLQSVLSFVQTLPIADGANIGLIGHSRGCQIGYAATSSQYAPYKCFVGLDPTWDGMTYEKLYNDWGKSNMLKYIKANKGNYTVPILHMATFRRNTGIEADSAAKMNAAYKMQLPITDLMVHAERTQITTNPEFGHEAFISQGGYDYMRMTPSLSDPEDIAYAQLQIDQYLLTCRTTLKYFTLYLKPESNSKADWETFVNELDWKTDHAIGTFTQAIPTPLSEEAWLNFVEANGMDSVEIKIEQEVKEIGYHRFSHENMAQHYFHKDNPLSKEIVNQYASYKPDTWRAYYLKGLFEMNMGNITQGQKYYDQALTLTPPTDMIDFLQNGSYYNW